MSNSSGHSSLAMSVNGHTPASGGPSAGGTDFEAFYHSVCSELQNKGEVHSMSKLFSHLQTDEERMR